MAKGDPNLIERALAKGAWRHVLNKNPKLQTWTPIFGALVLIAWVVAELAGHHETANTIRGIGGAIGVVEAAPVSGEEVLAVGTALVGVYTLGRGVAFKLWRALQKARGKA